MRTHAVEHSNRNGGLRPSKSHKDENFPVGSVLLRASVRAPLHAFYNFARAADDIADAPTLAAETKFAALDHMQAVLLGHDDGIPVALRLREVLLERKLTARHALDLLDAFRLDVTKRRYADWDDLMDYCAVSAMPVGRFVLAVHGENDATWPASDAICSALQVINHLQDCAADYRRLDRIYLPLDVLARHGADEFMLAAPAAPPPLRDCIVELAADTARLLEAGRHLSAQVSDRRLGVELAVIHALAVRLVGLLATRDPLSESVRLSRLSALRTALAAIAASPFKRAMQSDMPSARRK